MLPKLLLLILLLIIGCVFAGALLFRLARAAERLAVLQKDLAENDKKLKAKMDDLQRQRLALEAQADVKAAEGQIEKPG